MGVDVAEGEDDPVGDRQPVQGCGRSVSIYTLHCLEEEKERASPDTKAIMVVWEHPCSWVASMLGSAGFIFARNPTQTFSQKLVQCRMVAQGATVAVLIASAGLSRISFDDHDPLAEQREAEAHSWEHMVSRREQVLLLRR